MIGIVRAINRPRRMVAILTEEHGHTIIEFLGDEDIEVGDRMCWKNDTGLGSETYTNMTKQKNLNVYALHHWVPASQLRQRLLTS